MTCAWEKYARAMRYYPKQSISVVTTVVIRADLLSLPWLQGQATRCCESARCLDISQLLLNFRKVARKNPEKNVRRTAATRCDSVFS